MTYRNAIARFSWVTAVSISPLYFLVKFCLSLEQNLYRNICRITIQHQKIKFCSKPFSYVLRIYKYRANNKCQSNTISRCDQKEITLYQPYALRIL